ncbi:MAG: hypothetical protein P4N59_05715 [Negativicutes bacterium]|nr:hypothetical protein [Negativicutes bacterium]
MDFFLDGTRLLDKFPAQEFLDRGDPPGLAAIMKLSYAIPLGRCSPNSQLNLLHQLLLHSPPELPDGRCQLYLCGGNCECIHIGCFIEKRDGSIIWHDFQRGWPASNRAETFQDGKWQWIEFGQRPAQGFHLTGGPFYFDETAYRQLFEPVLEKLSKFEGPKHAPKLPN